MPLILDNPVRNYAWGSPTVIPELLGIPPTGEPQAELWMGAHPSAPSTVEVGGVRVSLADLIEQDPKAMLGLRTVERFGPRLPFLLKVLAVERPLSIQAHPTTKQAVAGFAAEDAAGIALDAANRSYRDRSHKPEMVVALTDFEALLGFRDPARSGDLLADLEVPALADTVSRLQTQGAVGLAATVRHWLELPAADAAALVAEVTDAARANTGELPELIRRLIHWYPGDCGVLVALLLQPVRLRPGEAVVTAAGVPHAYLTGVAVEPQASSDNTVRAGLTPKHVDVPEVLRILRYEPAVEPRVQPIPVGPAELRYTPGIEEFQLVRITPNGREVVVDGQPEGEAAGSAKIALAIDGVVELAGGGVTVPLRRGQSAFVPATDGPVAFTGRGTAFVVTPDAGTVDAAH